MIKKIYSKKTVKKYLFLDLLFALIYYNKTIIIITIHNNFTL